MKILHITSHLGGGVGKILSSIAIKDTENDHIILALQETKTTKFYDLCLKNNVEVYIANNCDIEKLCDSVDIIQLEWWHNPVTMEFMIKHLQNVSCRLIIWSHISGCNFPYISPEFVKLADKFIFSSKFSWDNLHWNDNDREFIQSNSSIIVSSGVEKTSRVIKNKTDSFNIGYLGNLSYNKTFPDTVKFYEEIAKEINNIKFIIAGDVEYGKDFVKDLNNSSVKDKVSFSGYVNNIREEFAKYDVLSYLLRDDNFATAENALLEGMSFGIVPIVFKQTSEQYAVQHMKTGLVVSNLKEYKEAMLYLYNNPQMREELSKNASDFVNNNMCIDNTVEKLNLEYDNIIKFDKHKHNFTDVFGHTPKEWFFTGFVGDIYDMTNNEKASNSSGLGQYDNYFKEYNMNSSIIGNDAQNINENIGGGDLTNNSLNFDLLNKLYLQLEDDLSKQIFLTRLIENVTKPTETTLINCISDNLYKNHDNYIKEINNIKPNEKIVIYGAGLLGEWIFLRIKNTKNILFCDQNHKNIVEFNNIDVISPDELVLSHNTAKIFVCTSGANPIVKKFLIENGICEKNIIESMYYDYEKQYFDDLIKIKQNEVFLDVGGYDGSTSVAFANYSQNTYKKIYVFEPDVDNLKRINNNKEFSKLNNVEILNVGAWNKKETLKFDCKSFGGGNINDSGEIKINCDSIDNLIVDYEVTFIKMDIEGAELNALIGAENIIKKYKPKLAISIYHKPEDILTIQSYIKSIVPEYKIYIRHYSISIVETVLYAIID